MNFVQSNALTSQSSVSVENRNKKQVKSRKSVVCIGKIKQPKLIVRGIFSFHIEIKKIKQCSGNGNI